MKKKIMDESKGGWMEGRKEGKKGSNSKQYARQKSKVM